MYFVFEIRVFVIPLCAFHDTHKSIEWSLFSQFNSPDLLSEVFIAIESGRNSFSQVKMLFPDWIANKLNLVSNECLPNPAELKELWTTLGVKDRIVDEIVRLRLTFDGGHILVSIDCCDDDLLKRVSYVVMAFWRFVRFSASRLLASGLSSRTLNSFTCGVWLEIINQQHHTLFLMRSQMH